MDVKRDRAKSMRGKSIRELLSGGDRRGIAQSNRVRSMAERNPSLVRELAALACDDDWLVGQPRARNIRAR